METKPILLVEDNQDDVQLIKRAFKRSRLTNELVVVRDGQEALDYLFCTGSYAGRSPDEMPCLILISLKLPKIDGLEVLKRIRADQRTQLIPVVVLTSSEEERKMVESYKLGANSYVIKPVDSDKFFKAIQQLELYWTVMNEFPVVAVRSSDEQTAESPDS
jgi:two-component system response regulator